MARTVKVGLLLEAKQYRDEAKQAARDTKSLEEKLADAAKAGDKAGTSLDGAGKKAGGSGRAAKVAAADYEEMRRQLSTLDRQIQQTERSITSLAKGYAETGKADLLEEIRKQKGQLSQLRDVRKLLPEPDEKSARSWGGKLVGGIVSGGLSVSAKAGGSLGPVIGGAAGAAAAPVLVSALASALSAGTSLGILGVGVMAIAKNPAVADAGEEFGERFMGGLRREATRSLQGTILDQLDKLGDAGDRVTRRLGQGFDAIAPHVDGFTSKLIKLGERGVDAFVDVAEESGPALDGFGDSLLLIGDGVNYFVRNLADGGPEAANNLRMIAGATADLLKYTSNTLDAMNRLANNEWITGPLLPLLRKHYKGAADEAGALTGELGEQPGAAAAAGAGLRGLGEDTAFASINADTLTKRQKDLTDAQKALQVSLDSLAPSQKRAADLSTNLKKANDLLYGATMRNADANQAYEASWDDLSASVKENGRSLVDHTAKGRANRTAMIGLLNSSTALYFANIEAGESTDSARKKHERRTEAVRKEAVRLKLNKEETQRLIATYGRIPGRKTTNLVTRGVDAVADAFLDLAAVQLHLAKGTPLSGSLKRRLARAQYGMPDTKRAFGGPLPGYAPHDRADNVVYAGTPGEWVIQRPTVRKVERQFGPGAMEHFNRHGELPGMEKFADGGILRASRTRVPDSMLFRTTAGMTRIPSMREAASKVIPQVPAGGTGPWMERMLEARFNAAMISGFRRGSRTLSGNLSYHALNRAVDFPPIRAMAEFMYRNYRSRLREAITPWHEFNVHNGRNHRYTGAVWRQHAFGYGNAHNHFAMENGGIIREPIHGVGVSGRTYSFGEGYKPEKVTPMYTSGGQAGGGCSGQHMTIDFANADNEFGRFFLKLVRTRPGIAVTLGQLVGAQRG